MIDREQHEHARPLRHAERRVEALAAMFLELAHRVRNGAQRNLDLRAADLRGVAPLRLDPAREPTPAAADHAIDVHLEQALQSLDWSHLDNNNGTLTLDTFDDAMNDFRGKMINSVFSTDHPDGRTGSN